MRLRIAWTLSAVLSLSCGGHSDASLFAHPSGSNCSEPIACTGPSGCSGHVACEANGESGDCTCDSVAHDEAGVGVGGVSSGGTSSVLDSGSGGNGGVVFASGGTPNTDAAGTPDSAVTPVCPVGNYTAKLSGPYKSLDGIFGSGDVGATVTFSVDATGVVTGTYSGPSVATAMLSGSLDCSSGALNISVENGTYDAPFPVDFSGTMTGTYDAQSDRFVDGAWTLTEKNNANDGGQGTWVET